MDLLKSIDAETLLLLKDISKVADQNLVHAYLVGGTVRDHLLDVPTKDLDIVVVGNAMTMAQEFAKLQDGKIHVYPAFKTATVTLRHERVVDFASARKEKYVRPGAFPVVTFAQLKEDLFRRDFTINAMAISLNQEDWGVMQDPYEGKKDLKFKRIRILHDKSFVDDPTRILRALRFQLRFDFKIERHTLRLLQDAIRLGALNTIRPQRYKKEYDKILQEPKSSKMIQLLHDWGAIQGKAHVKNG